MNNYDRNRRFNLLTGEPIRESVNYTPYNTIDPSSPTGVSQIQQSPNYSEDELKEAGRTPYDQPHNLMSGMSQIASSGSPFGKAAGLAKTFGNESLGGAFSNLGAIAGGDGFQKVGAMGRMMGNVPMANTMSNVGKWQKPKDAIVDVVADYAKMTGPVGMLVGMVAEKALQDPVDYTTPEGKNLAEKESKRIRKETADRAYEKNFKGAV